MIKKIISSVLVILLVVTMLPISQNTAYAYVTSNDKGTFRILGEVSDTRFGKDLTAHKFTKTYTFGQKNSNNAGIWAVPKGWNCQTLLYNPCNALSSDPAESGMKWTFTDDSYHRPGDAPESEFGAVINLGVNKLLGATRKGQLKFNISTYVKTYDMDSDYAQIMTAYSPNADGTELVRTLSDKFDYNNGGTGTYSGTIDKNAYIFGYGLYAKRSGGTAFNKDLTVLVKNYSIEISDNVAPYLVSITVDDPAYIRQDAAKGEPGVYITMSEEVDFTIPTVTLTETGTNNKVTVNLTAKGNSGVLENGDITYNFCINKSDSKLVNKHFNKLKVDDFYTTDILGNKTLIKHNEITKILDFKSPVVTQSDVNRNKFSVSDIYGLSAVYYSISKDSKTNQYTKYNIGDLRNQKISEAKKSFEVDATEGIQDTGLFKFSVWGYDLDKKFNSLYLNLFLISPAKPIDFTLQNSEAVTFSYDVADIGKTNSLKSNLSLKTSIVPIEYLNKAGTKLYYKWSQNINDDLLNTTNFTGWEEASFKPDTNETYQLNIPVTTVTEGGNSYIKPAFDNGHLYVIPVIVDDTGIDAKIRTGLKVTATDKPVEFPKSQSFNVSYKDVNGCGCNINDADSTAHYSTSGKHTKDIELSVDNNTNLSKIVYSIRSSGSASNLTTGTILANASGNYTIPITKIMNTTGEYTVNTVLYSKNGTVSVLADKNISIENPIISRTNYIYNTDAGNTYIQFDLSYMISSIKESIDSVQIQFTDKDQTEFDDSLNDTRPVYSSTQVGDIDSIGSNDFANTPYGKINNTSKSTYRASLTNMIKNGNEFLSEQGEKRVHIKITTKAGTEIINNNAYIIKKTNTPPDIQSADASDFKDKYVTKLTIDDLKVKDLITTVKEVKYTWKSTEIEPVNWNDSSKVTTVSVSGTPAELTVPKITKELTAGTNLYETYYLSVYAKNSGELEKVTNYGPFNIVNTSMIDDRYNLSVKDDPSNKQMYVTIDDKLADVETISKANILKLTWEKGSKIISKEYLIDTGIATNLLKIPYFELSDLTAADDAGTWILTEAEIKNNTTSGTDEYADISVKFDLKNKNIESEIVKKSISFAADTISVENITGAKYKVLNNPVIAHKWSNMPTPVEVPADGKVLIDDAEYNYSGNTYIYVQGEGIITRFDVKKEFDSTPINASDIKVDLGMTDSIYNSDGTNNIVVITADNGFDINNIRNIKTYDTASVTSQSAISGNVFKIKHNSIDKLAIVLDEALIDDAINKTSILVEMDNLTKNISASSSSSFDGSADTLTTLQAEDNSDNKQRAVISTNAANAKLYSANGIEYTFDDTGKCEVYSNGKYILVYENNSKTYLKTLDVQIIEASKYIDISYGDIVSENGIDSVTATVKLPYGAYPINAPYGVAVTDEDDLTTVRVKFTKNAAYNFDVVFADGTKTDTPIIVSVTNLPNKIINLVTSGSAISGDIAYTYSKESADTAVVPGELINKDVKATLTLNSGETVLNNNGSNVYTFTRNGVFYFVVDTADGVIVKKAEVTVIDRDCPVPVSVEKYIWSDKNGDGKYNEGEEIGEPLGNNTFTKQNVLTKVKFNTLGRAVKLENASDDYNNGYVPIGLDENGYAYEFIKAYTDNGTDVLKFADALGNKIDYQVAVKAIDRSTLITQLNYSTTNFTNKDVIASMIANKAIERFDYVMGDDGNKIEISDGKYLTKDASPTFIFRENGTKDFNYKEKNYSGHEQEIGTMIANVSWIDKSIPTVKFTYDNTIVKDSVKLNIFVENEKSEDIIVKDMTDVKEGESLGTTVTMKNVNGGSEGAVSVTQNGTYQFSITNEYGNTAFASVNISCIDKQAPVISLNGRALTAVKKGDVYNDKGATAFDNLDGIVTSKIERTGTVDTSQIGEYEIEYKVKDRAGNETSIKRKVKVVDINGSVALVQGDNLTIAALKNGSTDVIVPESSIVTVDVFGIEGKYTIKYAKGIDSSKYTPGYFKNFGMYIGETGVVTMTKGESYTIFVQDQERNTFIFTVNAK